MAALDGLWSTPLERRAEEKCDVELDCPSCGKRTWESVTGSWFKCQSCLFYLTDENEGLKAILEKEAKEAQRMQEIIRRASASTIPELPCPDCGGILWDKFRDGGSHKCFECGYWINAGDPRLDELYGENHLVQRWLRKK